MEQNEVVLENRAPFAPATATEEQVRQAASQRKINVIWEFTQSFIAGAVVLAAIVATFYFALRGLPIPSFLSDAFFLIIGFYFGRTNHTRPSVVFN